MAIDYDPILFSTVPRPAMVESFFYDLLPKKQTR